ncbi:hypothetical protein [Paenibacillus glacialis]|uniref:Uncharacterized protein n=1 Tax=Paenibacillus glacialis TaxID=494026 RepID=A0A168N7X3_9BACL|nr:hypothetical protein [Paenibacillus glacialis]OAB45499.1 hypothetical protein PGLA_04405 [Paenibacillus glacialis]
MIYMDKDAALSDFLEKHVFNQWINDVILIDDAYKERQEQIDRSLCDAFNDLFVKASTLHEQGDKGKIRYIYCSYLRTSVMENKVVYRLDAYDSNWYLDPIECSITWNPSFMFDPLFKRMELLEDEKKLYARKITSMDIDEVKQMEGYKCHLLTKEFIKDKISSVMNECHFKQMADDSGLTVAVGEYRDESEIVFEYNGQGGDCE